MERDPLTAFARTLNRIAIATVVLYVLLCVAGVAVYLQIRISVRENETARKGLCALRADLGRRQLSSLEFLKAHPNGIPGIPASVIRNGVDNTAQTLEALQVVKCP
jgi:hypothetical protein